MFLDKNYLPIHRPVTRFVVRRMRWVRFWTCIYSYSCRIIRKSILIYTMISVAPSVITNWMFVIIMKCIVETRRMANTINARGNIPLGMMAGNSISGSSRRFVVTLVGKQGSISWTSSLFWVDNVLVWSRYLIWMSMCMIPLILIARRNTRYFIRWVLLMTEKKVKQSKSKKTGFQCYIEKKIAL